MFIIPDHSALYRQLALEAKQLQKSSHAYGTQANRRSNFHNYRIIASALDFNLWRPTEQDLLNTIAMLAREDRSTENVLAHLNAIQFYFNQKGTNSCYLSLVKLLVAAEMLRGVKD